MSLDVCECVRYMNQVSGETTGGGSISQRQDFEVWKERANQFPFPKRAAVPVRTRGLLTTPPLFSES